MILLLLVLDSEADRALVSDLFASNYHRMETQGDGSSALTNANIKQGDCVKRTVPMTPSQPIENKKCQENRPRDTL